jgi:hypothetical protein
MTGQAPARADAPARHSAAAPASIVAGVLVGVVCFVALNWLNAEWLQQYGRPLGQNGLLVLLAGVMAAAASALAHRYPGIGFWSGVALTALVIAGLLLGSPDDLGLVDGTDGAWKSTPDTAIRHASQFPVTAAVAGMLLAVSISAHRARAK